MFLPRKRPFRSATALVLVLAAANTAAADPPLIWPLCGRLGEVPGAWQDGDPCPYPQPDTARHDLPIHNGFGLRNFVLASRPVSFHRGIDLATRSLTFDNGLPGNPAFAVCDGYVFRIQGEPPDQTLELKCPEQGLLPGATAVDACSGDNPCITAAYRHVQMLRVVEGELLSRGAHLGYTGSTAPGGNVFAHLHFEFLDPRPRPSNSNAGRTAFSKDAINPLRLLPLARPTDATLQVQVDDGTAFADYPAGAPQISLRLQAEAGFQHDFVALEVEVYRPDGLDWRRVGKDLDLIALESDVSGLGESSEALGLVYPVADADAWVSRHAPEELSRFYSPFSSNSSLWQVERELTWYRTLFAGAHPGLDGLLERNAEGLLPDGQLSHDFDFRLIRPDPNPDQPIDGPNDPAAWWGLRIGLREFGSGLVPPYCLRVETKQLPASATSGPRRRVTWLAQPAELDCDAPQVWMQLWRDGFESP